LISTENNAAREQVLMAIFLIDKCKIVVCGVSFTTFSKKEKK
jgi:hypothetical protein